MTDEYTPSSRTGRRPLPAAIAVAAIALTLALGLWAAHEAQTARERIDALEQKLDDRLGEAEAQGRQVTTRVDALADSLAAQEQHLQSLHGTRRSGLLATEAEHMVRLAAQRLALLQDPAGALALLGVAEAAIQDIRDADTHAARAAIAADSAVLRTAGRLDIETLYLRLASMPEQADRLATQGRAGNASAATAAPVAPRESVPSQPVDWWSRVRAAFSSLITVRRIDERLDPMITDGERALAAQNFRLLVEHAQVALLQRRIGIYTDSLAQADAWLTRIAGGDPMLRAALRRELTTLRAMDIGQSLPELTASLAATRALVVRLTPEAGGTP